MARPYIANRQLELDCDTAKLVTIGLENWMFAGSEGGGRAVAITITCAEITKFNGIDPRV